MAPATRIDRWIEAALGAAGRDSPGDRGPTLLALRRFLLLAVTVESWHALSYPVFASQRGTHLALDLLLSAALGGALLGRFARTAAAVGAACVLAQIALIFPANGNHQLVALLALVFAALPEPESQQNEPALALAGARWVFLLVFFWAGLQKVLHGYWFHGEFLALEISRDPAFAALLGWTLPAGELTRLLSLGTEPGAGPFRVAGPLFLLVVNGAWLAELTLPPLLLFARTRVLAVGGCLLFLLLTELAAREVFFGALMAGLALLFVPGQALRRTLPIFVLLYAAVAATDLGLIPGWSFG